MATSSVMPSCMLQNSTGKPLVMKNIPNGVADITYPPGAMGEVPCQGLLPEYNNVTLVTPDGSVFAFGPALDYEKVYGMPKHQLQLQRLKGSGGHLTVHARQNPLGFDLTWLPEQLSNTALGAAVVASSPVSALPTNCKLINDTGHKLVIVGAGNLHTVADVGDITDLPCVGMDASQPDMAVNTPDGASFKLGPALNWSKARKASNNTLVLKKQNKAGKAVLGLAADEDGALRIVQLASQQYKALTKTALIMYIIGAVLVILGIAAVAISVEKFKQGGKEGSDAYMIAFSSIALSGGIALIISSGLVAME